MKSELYICIAFVAMELIAIFNILVDAIKTFDAANALFCAGIFVLILIQVIAIGVDWAKK